MGGGVIVRGRLAGEAWVEGFRAKAARSFCEGRLGVSGAGCTTWAYGVPDDPAAGGNGCLKIGSSAHSAIRLGEGPRVAEIATQLKNLQPGALQR